MTEESRRQHIEDLASKLVRREYEVLEKTMYYAPLQIKRYGFVNSRSEGKAAMKELKTLARNDADYKVRKLASSELEYVRMARREDLARMLRENAGAVLFAAMFFGSAAAYAGYEIYNRIMSD